MNSTLPMSSAKDTLGEGPIESDELSNIPTLDNSHHSPYRPGLQLTKFAHSITRGRAPSNYYLLIRSWRKQGHHLSDEDLIRLQRQTHLYHSSDILSFSRYVFKHPLSTRSETTSSSPVLPFSDLDGTPQVNSSRTYFQVPGVQQLLILPNRVRLFFLLESAWSSLTYLKIFRDIHLEEFLAE